MTGSRGQRVRVFFGLSALEEVGVRNRILLRDEYNQFSTKPLGNVCHSLPPLDYYSVAYVARPPLIRGHPLRKLNAEEVTVTCELLLDTALRYHCPYWLLDGRTHVREQPQALHDWMREDYLPRVREALDRSPCIAFLVPPAVWAGLPDRGYARPLDWQSHAARLGWFTDEASALDWLSRQRCRESQLPATTEKHPTPYGAGPSGSPYPLLA